MAVKAVISPNVSVAAEVWIATALLHKENPTSPDFENAEILARAAQEGLVEPQRPGVSAHVSAHAVAGKKPQPNDYRFLVETERGRRRLFREGDTFHPERKGKVVPSREDLPARYWPLLKWYVQWSKDHLSNIARSPKEDPLERLAGTWTFGDADSYLREMRDGWEGRP